MHRSELVHRVIHRKWGSRISMPRDRICPADRWWRPLASLAHASSFLQQDFPCGRSTHSCALSSLPSYCREFPNGDDICICRDKNGLAVATAALRSEEHTSELQSHVNLVCRLLLEKK